MSDLRIVFETVTPLFLGGAQPNERAELRPPSVKGALRFWYRALDPGYQGFESTAFGSTRVGQASVLLRVNARVDGSERWNPKIGVTRDGRDMFEYDPFTEGSGTHSLNGIVYLGYSLALKGNERAGIAAGRLLSLTATLHPRLEDPSQRQAVRRAWVAAVWCLAHLGGLGSRARRGLGSLRLNVIDDPTGEWQETRELAPCDATSPDGWYAQLVQGLRTLRSWYGARPGADHPVLDNNARIFLSRDGQESWQDALQVAGVILQRYRQRRAPDYQQVKDHMLGVRSLSTAPERAAFGLPLTFRFSSGQSNPVTIRGTEREHDRQPSALLIRIAHIGETYHPLFIRLNAPFLTPGATLNPGRIQLPRASHEILDEFLDLAVASNAYPEVTP